MDVRANDDHIRGVPVISKPTNRGPLFGGRATIVLLPNRGRDMIPVYRRYRERLSQDHDREGRGSPGDEDAAS